MSELALAAKRRQQTRLNLLLNLTLFALLVLMWVLLSLNTRSFATENNIVNLMRQASVLAIMAIGQTFVIITAGIDLSMGAVVGFSGVVVAMLMTSGVPIALAIILTLIVGGGIGVFHAFGIIKLGLPPFIMTLATLTALSGISLLMTNGSSISGLPDAFTGFSRSAFLGVPSLFWMVIVIAVPAYIFLQHTRWGRYLFAVGSNAEAARLTGVNVHRILYLAYTLSAMLSTLAGILTSMRIGIGQPTAGQGQELQAIASSVIGGTSLFGAVGSIQGPLLGSILLSTIRNGANLLNVNSFWQQIITGGLIILVVYFDQLRRRRR